jgi:hypothetical protein
MRDTTVTERRRIHKIVVLALGLSWRVFGQSAPDGVQPESFRVQGTIVSPWDSFPKDLRIPEKRLRFREEQSTGNSQVNESDRDVPIPRTEIIFHGPLATKTVTVDEKGSYQVDLPLGVYEMTARGPRIGAMAVTEYKRLFRVTSSTTIIINGKLNALINNCDVVVSGDTETQRLEEWKNACGGEDIYSYPSKDGVPLQLYISYPRREVAGSTYLYGCEESKLGTARLVFVAYNLFSLEAQKVFYDKKAAVVEASGNVIVSDATGASHRAESIRFVIRDGEAVQLR